MTTRITKNQFTGGIAATDESTITGGSLTLDTGRNVQWGGAFSNDFPSIWGHSSLKRLRFATSGANSGIIVEMTDSGMDVTGDLTVSGDFTVSGNTTYVNSDNLQIEDLNITLANGSANSFVADGAGITIDGANATFNYEHGGGQTRFEMNNGLYVTGSSTNSISTLKATKTSASQSNNTYTLEIDSSAHTSNLTSAGAMAVDVNSGRAFTINGFGRVGVGTDSPDERLHIHSTSDTTIKITDDGIGSENYGGYIKGFGVSGSGGRLQLGSVDADVETLAIEVQEQANGLHFRTKDGGNGVSSRRLTILGTSGNVGIGTASPYSKLEVASSDNVNSYSDGAIQVVSSDPLAFVSPSNLNPSLNRWGFKLRENNEGDFSIHDHRQSSTRLLIDDSGKVCIGTTTPVTATKLIVDGGIGVNDSSTGTGNTTKISTLSRAYTMSTSATNVLEFDDFGNGGAEITVFRIDATSPAGCTVSKLYIAFQGSGTNITAVSMVQDNKVGQGSVHQVIYTITENNNTATLVATGSDNDGEAQTLVFHCVTTGALNHHLTIV